MKKKLKELAVLVGGTVVGDKETAISGVASISDAQRDDLTFVLDSRNLASAERSLAKALVIPDSISTTKKPALRVKQPRLAMAKIIKLFATTLSTAPGIHRTAVIGENCKVAKDAAIGANTVLGNNVKVDARVKIYPGVVIGDEVTIGEDTIIYSQVSVYDRVIIGKRVILHSGAVIGADGFGFVSDGDQRIKIPQLGTVIIEDDVEVQANSCIDRATLGQTIIRRGTKIDNLVQVGHNVTIGEGSVLVAQAGVAGSATLGKNVTVAGQAGISGHITVGDNAMVLAKSGVTHSVPPDSIVSGFPAQDHKKDLYLTALIRRLPNLFKRLDKTNKR